MVIQNNRQSQLNQINQVNETNKNSETKQKQNSAKSIFAGDLNLIEDPIAKKRKEAQQKALGIVQNAWEGDRAIEASIQERRDNYQKLKLEKEEAQSVINDLEGNKAALKEEYGIKEGSQEQKDLELLERNQEKNSGLSTEEFTDEEQKRLAELMETPLTDYQKSALDLNKQEIKFKKDKEDAEKGMRDAVADIRGIKLEKLKADPMVEAQNESESILASASKEIIGMLKEEAVEHIDEKLEEEEEKAKENAEEEKEKEEQIDERQEKKAIQEALIEKTKEAVEKAESVKKRNDREELTDVPVSDMMELTQTTQPSGDVQKKLDDIKNSMNLLEADLKGIQVDVEI